MAGPDSGADGPLVALEGLRVRFPLDRSPLTGRPAAWLEAVAGVDLEIAPGETVGLVGESGSGKSTTGRAILRLHERGSARYEGRVLYRGRDLATLPERELRGLRRELQIVFQDPYGALNPRMRVAEIVGEPLRIHRLAERGELRERVAALLEEVGLPPAVMDRYPRELSGGQRQRVGIARALALRPRFLVCDEPVSALDVSIRAQILNLLVELRERHDLAYLFIAHDLAAVRQVSHRIAVMFLGRLVEIAPAETLYRDPKHPYTKALLSAVLIADPAVERGRDRIILDGELPDPLEPPSGCVFHTRCPQAERVCCQRVPTLEDYGEGHRVACLLAER